MSTTIEIWRSAAGDEPDDFALLATVADGEPWSFLDSPVASGQLYIYKARRFDNVFGEYSPFSPLAFVLGPYPGGIVNTLYPNANAGAIAKVGYGVESIAGQPVKASRLFRLKSFEPGKTLGPEAIEIDEISGSPGVLTDVDAAVELKGLKLGVYASPESIDGLLAATLPLTTAAVAVPAAPTGVAVTQGGTPGSTNRSYTVVARGPQGDSAASTAGTTATGNAALSPSNYDIVKYAGVAGATSYLILLSGNIVGQTQGLSFNVTSGTGTAYSAPSGPTGNVQTYKGGFGANPISVAVYYGLDANSNPLILVVGGCVGDKLSIGWEKTAKQGFMLDWTFNALAYAWGYQTLAAVGLDVATSDTLGLWSPAKAIVKIGGALADINKFGFDIDRNLISKDALTGYLGPNSHIQQGSKHKGSMTAYFSTDAEMKRFQNEVAASAQYSKADGRLYFPIEAFVAQPVNAGGIVNQFGVLATYATYTCAPVPDIKGKDGALELAIEFAPRIDPTTGNDFSLTNVNSLSGATITNAGTPITGWPANAISPYTS